MQPIRRRQVSPGREAAKLSRTSNPQVPGDKSTTTTTQPTQGTDAAFPTLRVSRAPPALLPPLTHDHNPTLRSTTTSTMLRNSVVRAAGAASASLRQTLPTVAAPFNQARQAHAISNPTLANIEKRWEAMPPQEQADLWMALRDRMKVDWNELTLQEKKAGMSHVTHTTIRFPTTLVGSACVLGAGATPSVRAACASLSRCFRCSTGNNQQLTRLTLPCSILDRFRSPRPSRSSPTW